MKTRIALAQVSAAVDPKQNLETGLALMEQAAAAQAKLIVFPEISFGRFFPQQPGRKEPFNTAEPVPGPMTEQVAKKARSLGLVTIINLFEKADEGFYYDTSPIIDADGSLLGVVRMRHLAEEPGFHEKGYYTPGPAGPQQVFQTAVGRLGVAICYDRHYASVMTGLALAGADIVCVPQAGAVSDPLDQYESEMRAASFQYGYQVALANRVGQEEVLTFAGSSFLTDPEGHVVAKGGMKECGLIYGDLDTAAVRATRRRRPFLRDLRRDLFNYLEY